ncbi:hypothetical protein LEMLEM_LOCUS24461, partial [Lemmus lemmus]
SRGLTGLKEGSPLSPFFPERFEDVSCSLVLVWIILKTSHSHGTQFCSIL